MAQDASFGDRVRTWMRSVQTPLVFALAFGAAYYFFSMHGEPEYAPEVEKIAGERAFTQALETFGASPVLVDFSAVWCGPCRRMAPHLNRLAREGTPVLVVDIDENPDLAQQYAVQAVPTVMIFRAGEPVLRRTGYQPFEALRELMRAAV